MNVLFEFAARRDCWRGPGSTPRACSGSRDTCRCRACGRPPMPPASDVARVPRSGRRSRCRPSGRRSQLRPLLAHHDRLKRAADEARQAWETAIFDPEQASDPGPLDDRRRRAATLHQMTRGYFYPLLFPRRPRSRAGRSIPRPASSRRRSVGALRRGARCRSRSRFRAASCATACAEYWLRAPTPSPRLGSAARQRDDVCARHRAGRRRGRARR